jgi:hypothetical protein
MMANKRIIMTVAVFDRVQFELRAAGRRQRHGEVREKVSLRRGSERDTIVWNIGRWAQ